MSMISNINSNDFKLSQILNLIELTNWRDLEYDIWAGYIANNEKTITIQSILWSKYNDDEFQTYIPEIVTDTENTWVRTTLRIKDLNVKKGGEL
ncbi:hypothetical protein Glove_120g242 [Diversispora epigaea]|uniref:Uncharacterized protein n=1 Tax=Diversispora epigaea TaxID=1348612 RepID=A0A397J923_9GLOM|nr:hypothetical protein Glove_120g242 [Diversispora epigaea]